MRMGSFFWCWRVGFIYLFVYFCLCLLLASADLYMWSQRFCNRWWDRLRQSVTTKSRKGPVFYLPSRWWHFTGPFKWHIRKVYCFNNAYNPAHEFIWSQQQRWNDWLSGKRPEYIVQLHNLTRFNNMGRFKALLQADVSWNSRCRIWKPAS